MTRALPNGYAPSPWTPARVERAEAMWNSGNSAAEIAAALSDRDWKPTRNAVIGVAHRKGWTKGVRRATAPLRAPPKRQTRQAASASAAALVQRAKRKVFSTAYKLSEIVAPTLGRAVAFEPIPGTTPRPWEDRKPGECAWPVGVGPNSCCAPIFKGSWCLDHHRLGHVETPRFRMIDPDRRRAGRC